MKRFLSAILAVIIIVGMLVSGCGEAAPAEAPEGAAPTEPQYGGTLKILSVYSPDVNIGWPPDYGPQHLRATYYIIYEPLIRLYRDGTVEPMLATDWEFAPDYSSITFELRRGVKFHDGTDFKADAVKFMIDTNIETPTTGTLNWESGEIIDDYTVRLNFTQYENTLWGTLAGIGCMMVSPTAYNTHGLEWMRSNPVGTGPFMFDEIRVDQYVRLKRFDDYWQEGLPYLDGFELVVVADQTTLELAFLTGEGHAADTQPAKAMYDMAAKGYDVYAPLMGVSHLIPPNDPDSPFADKMVREALEYAIDKEAVAEVMGYGLYKPVTQMCSPDYPVYDPTIVGREYDPERAIELLDEAGYGTGIKTTICTPSPFQAQAVIYQEFLEEVGITAELEVLDWMAFYEMMATDWGDFLLNYCHGGSYHWISGLKGLYTPYGRMANGMIEPEGIRELMDAAVATPDPDELIDLTRQFLRLISDEAVIIPVYADSLGYFASPKVHGADWTWSPETTSWRPDTAWLED
jgi:peptide/nickel transport system substrate-binding protein